MSDERQQNYPFRGLDLDKPSVARVYDYMLGGKANWAVDREFGNRLKEKYPLIANLALANRQFLDRAVRYLVDQGIRQFVDIGAGVPTMGSTHEVADEVAPGECRVVYVDHEAVAVAHSEALLHEHGDPKRHAVINADLRDPIGLWHAALDTGRLNPDEPIGLLLIAVLHVQQPDAEGNDIGAASLAKFRDLVPSGSYLALSHATDDGVGDELRGILADIKRMYDTNSSPIILRGHAEIAALFDDFEIVEPGLAWAPEWHAEDYRADDKLVTFDQPSDSVVWVGVGRKP